MTSLSKRFMSFLLLMIGGFIALFSFSSSNPQRAEAIQNIQTLTTLPSTVNSTPFLEKRVKIYDDFSNRIYPQMSESSYGSFVYAQ